ncbi:MAG: GPR endopeptidase [Bacillota bacterium]|nr:GPR endopeptidase [Bacillota bacterium]
MNYRTDLAIERKEMLDDNAEGAEVSGVSVEKYPYGDDVVTTIIKVLDEDGAKALGKPVGDYITIEASGILDESETTKQNAVAAVNDALSKLIRFHYKLKVMVVGLGNNEVTPDSLGPRTAGKIKVTRHLFIMFDADGDEEMSNVSCMIPGVSGTTGIETADLVRKAVEITRPEFVVVIDSLAARSIERVSTTIQITDTGISPGAGMGNRRTGINEETIGTKVVAIGVPTVIDATTIIRDVMIDNTHCVDEIEKYIEDHEQNMIVTSTDIDMIIKEFSDIIAEGINKTLHPGIYS